MDKVTPPSDADRRTLARVPAGLKVEYKYDSSVFQGMTADISEGGIFLLSDRPALVDTKIYLRISLPEAKAPIKIIGIVRRKVEPYEGEKPGMGIKFEVIYAEDISQMKRFISTYLGLSVPDGAISQVAGTRTFKHVMPPEPGRKATGPAPAASKAGAVQRRRPERDDRRALKKLDFSYSSWLAQRAFKIILIAAAAAGLYFGGSWILELISKIL